MATCKNTVKAVRPAFDDVEIAHLCYETLAALAGARGILSEIERAALPEIPEPDDLVHIDRLLRRATDHVKEVADVITSLPPVAANG